MSYQDPAKWGFTAILVFIAACIVGSLIYWSQSDDCELRGGVLVSDGLYWFTCVGPK